MAKYVVHMMLDATHHAEVDADDPEQALEKAYEEVGVPSVCCQCSDKIEVGELLGAVVTDDDEEVLNTCPVFLEHATVEQLRTELKKRKGR